MVPVCLPSLETQNLKEFSKCGLLQNSLDTINASENVSFWKAIPSTCRFGARPNVFSHTPFCSCKMSSSSILCVYPTTVLFFPTLSLKPKSQTAFSKLFQIQFSHLEQGFTFKLFPQSHLRAQSPKPSPPKPLPPLITKQINRPWENRCIVLKMKALRYIII